MIKYVQIVLKFVLGYTSIVILQSKFAECFRIRKLSRVFGH